MVGLVSTSNRTAVSWVQRQLLAPALSLLVLLGASSSEGASPKPLLVHYMPWYEAKPFSADWGWHWTMNHFQPDHTNAAGQREIASWYYPQIGPYDSADPVVLEYHVLLLKLAGIDGVIADWYGMDHFNDYAVINERTLLLQKYAARARLSFCLCYEDRSIDAAIKAGRFTASEAVAHAQEAISYAARNYFNHPGYLRQAGQPVLLNFGPIYFHRSDEWTAIFSVLNATNQPKFFSLDRRLPAGAGGFGWPPMHLSQATSGNLSPAALEQYLDHFEADGRRWSGFISPCFPRFHDIYLQAKAGASYGALNDAEGAVFRSTLARALTNNSCMVQLVTWNDFGEGTVLEPTAEHGYRDLTVIQEYRRRYLDPGFSGQTDDLKLPLRVYRLRRACGNESTACAELDRVFEAAVSGDLRRAEQLLKRIETHRRASD
jgi:hypothetical protein